MKIRSIKKLVSEFTCSLWPLRSQEFYSEVRFNKHFFIDLWAMLQTQKYPLLPILGKFTDSHKSKEYKIKKQEMESTGQIYNVRKKILYSY